MLNEEIQRYIDQRLSAKLEPIDKALAKPSTTESQRDKLMVDRETISAMYVPRLWLNAALQSRAAVKST